MRHQSKAVIVTWSYFQSADRIKLYVIQVVNILYLMENDKNLRSSVGILAFAEVEYAMNYLSNFYTLNKMLRKIINSNNIK